MANQSKGISVAILLQMIRYMEQIGLDAAAVMETAGLDRKLLMMPDARVPADRYMMAQKMAARSSGDPWFGLQWAALSRRATGPFWAI